MKNELGKIESVFFGLGGYQDSMIGLHTTFISDRCCFKDSKCAWDSESIKWSDTCKWSEYDRDKQYSELLRYVSKLLSDAKVNSIDKLKNIPVELTFENNTLKEWRILTEVL